MISYVIPTRDRAERLWETLCAIGGLREHDGEVIVIDNASRERVSVPRELANGLPVRLLRMEENIGAAARNWGVQLADPRSEWVVMLDDDSHPVGDGLFAAMEDVPADVAAVMADIFIPSATGAAACAETGATACPKGQAVPVRPLRCETRESRLALRDKPCHQMRRESGGLPEVFIGCGVAIRRRALLEAGGYDASFGYYAEEYDLSAKLLMRGWRVAFDPRFVVHHHKVLDGRDMDMILRRLVRNNGWVLQRYAPDSERRELLRDMRRRYRAIAEKEGALAGYARGLDELRRTIADQHRAPLPQRIFDRFTGLTAARHAIQAALAEAPFAAAAIVAPGKNEWCVRQALHEAGVDVTDESRADAIVIGTMSPGPAIDAAARLSHLHTRIVVPTSGLSGHTLARLAG